MAELTVELSGTVTKVCRSVNGFMHEVGFDHGTLANSGDRLRVLPPDINIPLEPTQLSIGAVKCE